MIRVVVGETTPRLRETECTQAQAQTITRNSNSASYGSPVLVTEPGQTVCCKALRPQIFDFLYWGLRKWKS